MRIDIANKLEASVLDWKMHFTLCFFRFYVIYNEKQNRFSPYNLTEKKCDKMKHDLTSGRISTALLAFAGPMVAGNLLQQMYNLADTWIVGRCLGEQALAAVGSTYTLTTLLYSVIIGLCMGSGAVGCFCIRKGSVWNHDTNHISGR